MDKGRIVDGLSLLLIVTGLGFLSYVSYHMVTGSAGNREGLDAFEAARTAQEAVAASSTDGVANNTTAAAEHTELETRTILPPAEVERAAPAIDMSEWSAKRIAEYDAGSGESPGHTVPEGIVRIPSVELEVPVFPGTEESNLARGAGRIEGTVALGQPGNSGIAAHRDSYFRALKDVQLGDPVEVETLSGIQQYRIVNLSVVNPEDVHVLDPTERDSITLVTCYPFYYVGNAPQRYIVRAEKT